MAYIWLALLLTLTVSHAVQGATAPGCTCGIKGAAKYATPALAAAAANISYDSVGGMNISSPGEWCWQASVENEIGNVICTAVLIDPSFAITPAQCIDGRSPHSTFIRVGAYDLSQISAGQSQLIPVDSLTVHNQYVNVQRRTDYNIGLIKFSRPIDCGLPHICLACLPPSESGTVVTPATCTATTWNVRYTRNQSPEVQRPLRERTVQILDKQTCSAQINNEKTISPYTVSNTKMCVKEQSNDTKCMGDLGDPLVCQVNGRYEITGLNTLGFSCLHSYLPSFYTRVGALTNWIKAGIAGNQTTGTPSISTSPIVLADSPAQVAPQSGPAVVIMIPVPSSTAAPVPAFPTIPPVTVPIVPTPAAAANPFRPATLPSVVAPPVVPLPVGLPIPVPLPGSGGPTRGTSGQHMSADGTLEQYDSNGSVQRTKINAPVMMTNSKLQEVKPGQFRVNLGGTFVDVTMDGLTQVQMPGFSDTSNPMNILGGLNPYIYNFNLNRRRKRQASLAGGASSSSSSSGNQQSSNFASMSAGIGTNGQVSGPIINSDGALQVGPQDIQYDANRKKLIVTVPQSQANNGQSFTQIAFNPLDVESVTRQILAQQEQILAQIAQLSKQIQAQSGAAVTGGNGANAFVSTSASNLSPIIQPAGPPTTGSAAVVQSILNRAAPPPGPMVAVPARGPVGANRGPVSLSSGAQAASSFDSSRLVPGANPQAKVLNFGSNRPTAGRVSQASDDLSSQSDAAFQGNQVSGQLVNAPGSASSSVSASS